MSQRRGSISPGRINTNPSQRYSQRDENIPPWDDAAFKLRKIDDSPRGGFKSDKTQTHDLDVAEEQDDNKNTIINVANNDINFDNKRNTIVLSNRFPKDGLIIDKGISIRTSNDGQWAQPRIPDVVYEKYTSNQSQINNKKEKETKDIRSSKNLSPQSNLEQLKMKKKRIMNDLANNLNTFRFKQVNLEFQRNDREAIEEREFQQFLKTQKVRNKPLPKSQNGRNIFSQRPKTSQFHQTFHNRAHNKTNPLSISESMQLNGFNHQRVSQQANPNDLQYEFKRPNLKSAHGARFQAFNDFRAIRNQTATHATTAASGVNYFSNKSSLKKESPEKIVMKFDSSQDYAEQIGLSEQNWLRSTTKLLTQQLHQARRQEKQDQLRQSGNYQKNQTGQQFKNEPNVIQTTENELHNQIDKKRGAMPARYELKSGKHRSRQYSRTVLVQNQNDDAKQIQNIYSPSGAMSKNGVQIYNGTEMQWEAVTARKADHEIPDNTASSKRFNSSAEKQQQKRAKSSILIRKNKKQIPIPQDQTLKMQKSEGESSTAMKQTFSFDNKTSSVPHDEISQQQKLVGYGIHPMSNPNLKSSENGLKSWPIRSRQDTENNLSANNTKRSNIGLLYKTKSKTKSKVSRLDQKSGNASNKKKESKKTSKLGIDDPRVFDVIQQYEQHSNFLQQLENFPNYTVSPSPNENEASNEQQNQSNMHYNPIKVHYREEREHQENGIDEKKQDKSNDPNNANIQANNSYNELMTNIRVRSKTSLEASQEDNKSKGCYLYDLDIEQNMKITSKHEIITPQPQVVEKQVNDKINDTEQIVESQPLTDGGPTFLNEVLQPNLAFENQSPNKYNENMIQDPNAEINYVNRVQTGYEHFKNDLIDYQLNAPSFSPVNQSNKKQNFELINREMDQGPLHDNRKVQVLQFNTIQPQAHDNILYQTQNYSYPQQQPDKDYNLDMTGMIQMRNMPMIDSCQIINKSESHQEIEGATMYPAHNYKLYHWKEDKPKMIQHNRTGNIETSQTILRKALHNRKCTQKNQYNMQYNNLLINDEVMLPISGQKSIKQDSHCPIEQRPKTKPPRLNLKNLNQIVQKKNAEEEQLQSAKNKKNIKPQAKLKEKFDKARKFNKSFDSTAQNRNQNQFKLTTMKPISVKKLFEEVKHIQKGFQNQKGKKDVASKQAKQQSATAQTRDGRTITEDKYLKSMEYKRYLYTMLTEGKMIRSQSPTKKKVQKQLTKRNTLTNRKSLNNITSGNLSNGSLPSQKQLDKIENNIPKGDKEMNDQKNKMEQIKKDLRIINQITQRLVISHQEQPRLLMNKEVDIEVVQNNKQVYTFETLDVPTPIRIRIKYTDKEKSIKDQMLAVSCQFHPFEEKKENAGIDQDKRWKKSYLAPETIIVHTQGDKQKDVKRLLSKRPGKSRVQQAKDGGIFPLTFCSPSDSNHQSQKRLMRQQINKFTKRRLSDGGQRFSEQKLYVMFQSPIGCSILVKVEQVESRANINKQNLLNRKAEMLAKFEQVDKFFSRAEPFYVEMLEMVEEKKMNRKQQQDQNRLLKVNALKLNPVTGNKDLSELSCHEDSSMSDVPLEYFRHMLNSLEDNNNDEEEQQQEEDNESQQTDLQIYVE